MRIRLASMRREMESLSRERDRLRRGNRVRKSSGGVSAKAWREGVKLSDVVLSTSSSDTGSVEGSVDEEENAGTGGSTITEEFISRCFSEMEEMEEMEDMEGTNGN